MTATFGLSASMLGVQICWTRIFSFMIWYHFAFLVLSTALLGFAVGGLLLNLRPRWLEPAERRLLYGSALGFAAGTGLSLLVICNLPFDGGVLDSARNFALFLVLVLVLAASFCAAGLFIAAVIARNPGAVARIYGANLAGSGAGCGLSVPLLNVLPPTSSLLAFGLIAAAASLLLWPSAARRGRMAWAPIFALLLVAFVRSLNPLAAPFYLKSTKPFPKLDKRQIAMRMSNSLSVIDLFASANITGLWGLSDAHYFRAEGGRPLPARLGLCIDGWALTFMYHSAGEITHEPVFDYLPSTLVYDVSTPHSALVLGAGGGIDIIGALRRGVSAITAVEINPAIMRLDLDMWKFNGDLFHRPQVEPVVAEGRAFVRAAGSRRWDLIQLSGVDTLAASQAGAFTLAEGYLYTREAFTDYLRHLNPGGVLTLTRWMSKPARQTLRVITVADAALHSLGVQDTRDHILLVTDRRREFSVFLISPTPFTAAQSERALDVARRKGFIPLAIPGRPLGPTPNLYERLIGTANKAAFIDAYPFDISVTTDDKPFFFEHTRWKNAWRYPDRILDKFNGHLILLVTTLLVALLGFAFVLLPARHGLPATARGRGHLRTLTYFACLGLGYVLVEMVLVQKFTLYLGNPAYALAIVLCAMLVFAGVGSLLSPKLLAGRRGGGPARPAALVAVCLLGYRFGLDACLNAGLAWPLGLRIASALALLAPPAVSMGLPFPSAVRALAAAKDSNSRVLRGWVINGYCSVLGSCVAMILSISFGFGVVLTIGALIYALAAVAWPRAAQAAGQVPSAAASLETRTDTASA